MSTLPGAQTGQRLTLGEMFLSIVGASGLEPAQELSWLVLLAGETVTGGLLSPLARAQYAALAQLRKRVFINSLRSSLGALELGARTVAFVLYGFIGLAIAVGAGAYSYVIASDGSWQYLPIVFWAVCLMWQVVPILLSTFQEQFDLGSLLRFPVGFQSYFLLYVVFGLSDISTILGFLCCLGILIGITIAQPALFAWTVIVLLIFAAFNILLVRAVFAWIDRWLSQRRTREIVGALLMVFLLSLQLLNPAVWQHSRQAQQGRRQRAEFYRKLLNEPWVQTAKQVQALLPPGLAAGAVEAASAGEKTVGALESYGFADSCSSWQREPDLECGCGGNIGVKIWARWR